MSSPTAPDTRITFRIQHATCICPADLVTEFEQIYVRWHWVHDFFKSQKGAKVVRGRQPLLLGTIAGRPVLVKRLAHGGLLARLTRDRFLSASFLDEHLHVVDRLRELNVPTPRVLFSTFRRENGFIRAEIGVDYIGPGMDTADLLFGKQGKKAAGWEQISRGIGRLVRHLHSIGFRHPDLNLMNFYRHSAGELHILDMIKSKPPGGKLSMLSQSRNLARLMRSVRKLGRRFEPSYVEGICEGIMDGYRSTDAAH